MREFKITPERGELQTVKGHELVVDEAGSQVYVEIQDEDEETLFLIPLANLKYVTAREVQDH